MSEMSDQFKIFPMYFVRAAQPEGEPPIIYISSDDEEEREESMSTSSILDVLLSSGDESLDIVVLSERWRIQSQ